MTPATLRFFSGGSCVQFEHVVLRTWTTRVLRFPAMFALIEHPLAGVILFDTGYSARFWQETQRWPERLYRWTTPPALAPGEDAVSQLAAIGCRAGDVGTIVLSHFHADHVGGVRDFPGARLRCLRPAWDALGGRSRLQRLRAGVLPGLLPDDIETRLDVLDGLPQRPLPPSCAAFGSGGDLCGDGSVLVVPLGGHAPGQCGLFVHAVDGRQYFLVADACWTLASATRRQMPHPITRALFDDTAVYRRVLIRLGDVAARSDAPQIVPSHCEATVSALVHTGAPA